MVCGRPHLVRSAVQTMRRRPPSGWAACQLCNDGAQSCEDSPVRALFTGKLGLMTGRAKTKSVRCERFSPGSWNCDAGDATADPVNRLADRVCHAGQSDYSLHLYGHMHIFFVHATVLVGIRGFYHITPRISDSREGRPSFFPATHIIPTHGAVRKQRVSTHHSRDSILYLLQLSSVACLFMTHLFVFYIFPVRP